MADHVDRVLEQWGAQCPDLDVSPMAVIGRLSRLSRLIDAELRRTFSAHGLDHASFDVLATLRRSAPPHRLTPAELMRASMVTSGAITQRLDRLQVRGLVTRTPSASDGRGVDVALTDDGRALIDRALPDHVETENRLLAALTSAERDALAGMLRNLSESLGDGVEPGRGAGGTPSPAGPMPRWAPQCAAVPTSCRADVLPCRRPDVPPCRRASGVWCIQATYSGPDLRGWSAFEERIRAPIALKVTGVRYRQLACKRRALSGLRWHGSDLRGVGGEWPESTCRCGKYLSCLRA